MTKPREPNGVEPSRSEDDIQREQLGPRGVPGAPDPAKMTPQREKKTPKHVDPGHTVAALVDLSDCCDIGLCKIIADIEQRAAMLLGDIVGETVAEVEAGRMIAFAPKRVDLRHAFGRCLGHRDRRSDSSYLRTRRGAQRR